MLSSFLFIKWRKEKKREKDEKIVIGLSSRKFGRCVALVVMKEPLRRISRRKRVSSLRMTGRILVSIGSGYLVFRLLDLG